MKSSYLISIIVIGALTYSFILNSSPIQKTTVQFEHVGSIGKRMVSNIPNGTFNITTEGELVQLNFYQIKSGKKKLLYKTEIDSLKNPYLAIAPNYDDDFGTTLLFKKSIKRPNYQFESERITIGHNSIIEVTPNSTGKIILQPTLLCAFWSRQSQTIKVDNFVSDINKMIEHSLDQPDIEYFPIVIEPLK